MLASRRMRYQLRIYQVRPEELDRFADEWRRLVVPLRRSMGFHVLGGWRSQDGDSFVWIVGFDGDFEAADAAYYASPERAALDPDPARLIRSVHARMLVPVEFD
jgi:NIPSNAP